MKRTYRKPKPGDWDYERPDEIETRLRFAGIDPEAPSKVAGLTNLQREIQRRNTGK